MKKNKTKFKSNKTEKEVLFEELYGAWSDMDDDLEKEIMESRRISERCLNLFRLK